MRVAKSNKNLISGLKWAFIIVSMGLGYTTVYPHITGYLSFGLVFGVCLFLAFADSYKQ